MTSLTIWLFGDAEGAVRAERELVLLSALDRLPIEDASVVIWSSAASAPHTRDLGNVAHLAPLDPSFWGLLHGCIFAGPLLGHADREPRYLQDVGIGDELIDTLRTELRPGTSAVITVTAGDVETGLAAAVAGGADRARTLHAHLTHDHAHNLHRVFRP